jgi:hypothetical protein
MAHYDFQIFGCSIRKNGKRAQLQLTNQVGKLLAVNGICETVFDGMAFASRHARLKLKLKTWRKA